MKRPLQPLMYYVTCPRRVAEYQLTRWCCLSLFGRDGGTGATTRVHKFLQQPLDLHTTKSRILPRKSYSFSRDYTGRSTPRITINRRRVSHKKRNASQKSHLFNWGYLIGDRPLYFDRFVKLGVRVSPLSPWRRYQIHGSIVLIQSGVILQHAH